jgi:hypoxia up-regulated 1
LVNKIVKDFYAPAEVGSHINGDESMAFGGALRAANLSIAFRVKQLHVYDGYSENVRAVVSNVEDGVIHESIIFNKDSEQGLKK